MAADEVEVVGCDLKQQEVSKVTKGILLQLHYYPYYWYFIQKQIVVHRPNYLLLHILQY